MKYLIVLMLAIATVGCSNVPVAKKDQFILMVPGDLMEPPQPLKQL